MTIELMTFHPNDVLFFRDLRSAELGSILDGIYPLPSVFFGAIRSLILHSSGVEPSDYVKQSRSEKLSDTVAPLVDIIGEATPEPVKGTLSIKGPFLYLSNRLYFQAPTNLFQNEDGTYTLGVPGENSILNDLGTTNIRPILTDEKRDEVKAEKSWISLNKLLELCLNMSPGLCSLSVLPESEIWISEPRYGHEREEQSHTVKDERLYQVNTRRFKSDDSSYAAMVTGMDLSTVAHYKNFPIGGKHHMVSIQHEAWSGLSSDVAKKIKKSINDSGRFFIYLATPSIFDKGWFPSPDKMFGLYPIGAALQKSTHMAGWDYAKGRAKALRRLAPAGSVYFYEIDDNQIVDDLVDCYLLNKSVSDGSSGLQRAGFGQTLIGSWEQQRS